jgi:hypothetical protein
MADLKAIEEKLARGEELTKEETREVMSAPNLDGSGNKPGKDNDDDDIEYEDIDGDKDSDKDKKAADKKADDASVGDKGKEGAPPAKKEGEAAKAEPDKAKPEEKKSEEVVETLKDKLERELGKPDNQEDLSDFSVREKGLFYAMKSERKKRQSAEADLDAFKFKSIKDQRQKEELAKVEQDSEKILDSEVDKLFEGKDGEDFVNIGELKKALKPLLKKAAVPKEVALDPGNKYYTRMVETNARDIIEARRIKDSTLPDYDKVMSLGPDIVEGNEDYGKQIAKAVEENRNPALLIYDLIRKDPRFSVLFGIPEKKEEKPPEKAPEKTPDKETLDKINKNDDKVKTSGAHGGGGGGKDDMEGYTAQQLSEMTPSQFRQVPKHIREKFLKDF